MFLFLILRWKVHCFFCTARKLLLHIVCLISLVGWLYFTYIIACIYSRAMPLKLSSISFNFPLFTWLWQTRLTPSLTRLHNFITRFCNKWLQYSSVFFSLTFLEVWNYPNWSFFLLKRKQKVDEGKWRKRISHTTTTKATTKKGW